MSLLAPTLTLPPALREIADRADAAERDRQDSAATAAIAALKASDPEPRELGDARTALAKARAAAEKARATLRQLEAAEYEAAQHHTALDTARDRHRRALARQAHAQHRVAAARERIEKEITKHQEARTRSTEPGVGSASSGAAVTVLNQALQHLAAAVAGDAHRIEDFDRFVGDAVRRAQDASETAATAMRLKRSRAEAARRAQKLWGNAA